MLVLSTAAACAEACTVPIEPRPFYGATLTLEEGCASPGRFHERVIINPGSKTPLSLGIYASRSYNANYNYNQDEGFVGVSDLEGGSFGFVPGQIARPRPSPWAQGPLSLVGRPATLMRSPLQGLSQTCRQTRERLVDARGR